jgi:hypothetical protein
LVGCKTAKKELPEKRTGQAKLIGVIEMVNPEQRYVLINCEQRISLAAGTELIAMDSNNVKSKLVVTPEHKGNYITADIKEGVPTVSSLVLQKIRESDVLPTPPKPGSPISAVTPIEMPGGTLPLIPPIEFPSMQQPQTQRAPSQQEALPLPTYDLPPDLSKLPPPIR